MTILRICVSVVLSDVGKNQNTCADLESLKATYDQYNIKII